MLPRRRRVLTTRTVIRTRCTFIASEHYLGPNQLMIGGPESWSALALREDSSKAVSEYSADGQKAKGAQDNKAKQQSRPKTKKPKKTRMPKVCVYLMDS